MEMSVETADLNSVRTALSDACDSTCTAKKRQAMMALEHFQTCDGYIESLVRIIDINDVGKSMTLESRHLAAVLLKNVINKRGASLEKQSKACAGMRPLQDSEKATLKTFLARYMYEPQCKVALQLSLAVAKLARLEGDSWVKDWPELITSIITILQSSLQGTPNSPGAVQSQKAVIPVDGASYGCTIRAICTLQELLSELSCKASSGCSSAVFIQGYSALCTQLYCIISKSWACNMKKLQPIMSALNQHAGSHYTTSHFLITTTTLPDVAQITGYTTREIESLFAHTILLSKVMRIVLEFGFEQIGSTYPTFYTNFWKTYLGSIKLLADFVRAHRPMCVEILKQRSTTNTNNTANKRTSEHMVYMKHILMTEDDADDPCDAYFPLGNESATISDTLSILNLSLKLIKHLVCGPVILQMKYPTLVLPSLECMVGFAYTMLNEEFPHAMQEYELSAQSPSNNINPSMSSSFIQVLTFEQAHTLYTLEKLRNTLPLSYVAKACSMLLGNVLKCSAYCEYNVYTTNPTTTNTNTTHTTDVNTTDSMEECPYKSSTSSGYDLKTAFFNTERVSTLLRMLLYPLLTYTKKELNEWLLNPEEFIISQQDTEPCYSVKTAAERLFFNLAEFAPETVCNILAPLLMDCVRQEAIYSPNNIHTNSNNEILAVYKCSIVSRYVHNRELCIWDAVYMCTGLGIAHLSSYFCKLKEQYNTSAELPCNKCPNFSSTNDTTPSTTNNAINKTSSVCGENGGASYWVQHYLGPMVTQLLKNPYSGCLEHKQQLLRSRLIWLLGVWMHKFEKDVLPHVLTILIDIISPGDSDIVVRMYAVEALHKLINLNVFDVTTLVYYVVKAVEALCLMVRTLEESDNKIAVLHLSGELIQLLSIQLTSLRPLVVPLAGYLENLWVETGPTDPTRSTILEVMTQLVRASKHYSASILPVTTPLIMFALSTGSNSNTVAPASHNSSMKMTDCGNEGYESRSKSGGSYGYLVKDGLALWLAVMQNLTEVQYSTYHKELQHVFAVCMTSLHISNTPSQPSYTTEAFVYNSWDILLEADSAVLITDILLCVEAYCLLGGEGYSILSDLNCRNALTSLYLKCLGKVDVKLVQYVVRPLQALVVSCPSLAGAYLNECGLLAHIIRIIMASAPCVNLQSLVVSYKTTDAALVSYLTLIAYILYVDPSTLYTALTVFVAEVVSYVTQCTGTKCDKVLTEAILLQQIVGVMVNLQGTLKTHQAALYTAKLWSLALLTLIPPTLINNAPLTMSTSGATNTNNSMSKGPATGPDCIIARLMLKLLNTVQCTFGKDKVEQYQREHCFSNTTTPNTNNNLDYSALSFWYPSTLSTEQLYGMVDSIVSVCKCSLKNERRKSHNEALLRQLDELLQGGSGEGLSMETSNMGGLSEMFLHCDSTDSSDSNQSQEEDEDSDSDDTECMNCTSGKDLPTDNTIELNMTSATGITAADGDMQQLDVCELPLRSVLKTRLTESYVLNAKVEIHLKEKCAQLRRVLGESHFASLTTIAELGI